MSRWVPEKDANRETAEWLLREMRRDLADAESLAEAAGIVEHHAGRVSHVILDIACGIAGAPKGRLEHVPTAPTLTRGLVTVELRRLGLPS